MPRPLSPSPSDTHDDKQMISVNTNCVCPQQSRGQKPTWTHQPWEWRPKLQHRKCTHSKPKAHSAVRPAHGFSCKRVPRTVDSSHRNTMRAKPSHATVWIHCSVRDICHTKSYRFTTVWSKRVGSFPLLVIWCTGLGLLTRGVGALAEVGLSVLLVVLPVLRVLAPVVVPVL